MESSNFPPDSETSFTFKVDSVKPCRKVSYMRTFKEILRKQILATEVVTSTNILGSGEFKLVDFTGEIEDCSHRKNMYARFCSGPVPGMVGAIHTAYHKHYALGLSVSDFIILIGQGLGTHINENAERLRKNFVDFEGKETLKVKRDDFVMGEQNDWSTVFGEFAEQIKKRVKADVYNVIIDDTSVATVTSRIVSEITLMDAVKSYFYFRVTTACGIPYITLEGRPEDWQRLKDKVKKLVDMNKDDCLDLKWWLGVLVPVVDKICEAGIERKVDEEFWSSIYKYRDGSGGDKITGWITKFLPYIIAQGGLKKRNPFEKFGVPSGMIPKQRCEVPFIWEYYKKEISMTFTAGFFGAEFDYKLCQLKPAHFWCVTKSEETSKQGTDQKYEDNDF